MIVSRSLSFLFWMRILSSSYGDLVWNYYFILLVRVNCLMIY